MNAFWKPNLDRRGRLVRAVGGVVLLAGAALAWEGAEPVAIVLAAGAVFCLVEALRGWCLLRACGLKTRL